MQGGSEHPLSPASIGSLVSSPAMGTLQAWFLHWGFEEMWSYLVFSQYKSRMSFAFVSFVRGEFGHLHVGESFLKLQIIDVLAWTWGTRSWAPVCSSSVPSCWLFVWRKSRQHLNQLPQINMPSRPSEISLNYGNGMNFTKMAFPGWHWDSTS